MQKEKNENQVNNLKKFKIQKKTLKKKRKSSKQFFVPKNFKIILVK